MVSVTSTLSLFGGSRVPYLGDRTSGDAALASYLRSVIRQPRGLRGLAVAVVGAGRVRFAGLGDRAGHGDVPGDDDLGIGPDTAFEIGSITKALTGMLFAELVRDGTVDPAEPLRALLTGVYVVRPELADTPLVELVSHRSGLPRLPSAGQALGMAVRMLRGGDPYAGQDTTWLLSTVGRARLMYEEPKVSYSNYGMAVLGHALAERAGLPYPELLRHRVLVPLAMADTGFHVDGAELPRRRAHGVTAGGRRAEPWRSSGYAPAGTGAWSTANDLAKLIAAMVAGTAPGADAATPRFDDGPDRWVGYGWFTVRTGGHDITWHNGGTGGFSSFVGFDRDAGRGVVVLANTSRSVDRLGLHLLLADEAAAGG